MWWEYPYFGSRYTGNECSIIWISKQHQPSNSSCKPKQPTHIKQVIISTIIWKKNESPSQAGNYKTTNLQEHTCKENWDRI